VAYDRPKYLAPRQLLGSNMCADFYYSVEPPVRKPEAFIEWAQEVFRWVRRFTPGWHRYRGYRVTEKVAAEIARGLEIVG
jgi:hypothetical protein